MRPKSVVITGLCALAMAVSFSSSGCGGNGSGSHFGGGGDGGGSSGSGGSGSSSGLFGDDGGGSGSSSGGTTAQCPSGTQCNVSCTGSATTSISGKVYDPALKNGLYNVVVYVPGAPLQPLPAGVPTGADACNCGALFKSGAVVATTTGVDGTFNLGNAPVGTSVPLVLQIGKWRRYMTVDTSKASCGNTQLADKTAFLRGTLTGTGVSPNDNMPDIAVSTGSADTLECLMKRIGLPDSEYAAGAGTTGHVHVFSGGGTGGKGGGGGAGTPEKPGMTGAPASDTDLWNGPTGANMMPYDIVLLSCEGAETYDANPAGLEAYLNAGGRAFGSHFHYAWFAGPLSSKQAYTAPADWGTNLATWTAGSNGNGNQANGKIVQTLNGSTAPFPKGEAFFQWLGLVGALGVNGAPAQELPIVQPRYNAVVGPNNKPSQPWINDATTTNTMYFSFDTPVGGIANPSGGAPSYCGRAVFSDLHVAGPISGGGPDNPDPPTGCADIDLSPQEKALEFMLFDLSSCVIPDTVAPPDGGGVLQ
jgi:hypothetical protein